jgi:anti-sigma28 factor (negative regulator of flagellin synthesis)
MKIPSSIVRAQEGARNLAADGTKTSPGLDATKQASVAQTTVRVVQEALARTGVAATIAAPSAQLSVDGSRISKLAGADKTKDSEKLDTAKLDAIKRSIEDGSFQVDYRAIAQHLVEQSAQRGLKRG